MITRKVTFVDLNSEAARTVFYSTYGSLCAGHHGIKNHIASGQGYKYVSQSLKQPFKKAAAKVAAASNQVATFP